MLFSQKSRIECFSRLLSSLFTIKNYDASQLLSTLPLPLSRILPISAFAMAPKQRKTQTGGVTSNAPPTRKKTGAGKKIQLRIDPDLLDCSICFHPLCSPVKQCENGHVACPSCWSKLQHQCHICNFPVVTRSIALDKVLEAAHLPCTYAYLGCRQFVSYSQMQVHTDTCKFGPSLCPIPVCAHKAFSGEWRAHFLKDHQNLCSKFSYGQTCYVQFKKEDSYYILLGPGEDLFLLVKEHICNVGNALSLYYIDLPHWGQHVFPYELKVITHENCITSSVQLNSQAVSIKEWKRGEVRGTYLLVPLGFTEQHMEVHVCL